MKVLVTGGAGFIGSHLCDRLLKEEHEVACVDDMSAGKFENIEHHIENENFAFIQADVTGDLMDWVFETGEFDVVFHQAASKKTVCLKDPIRDSHVNSAGTLNLLLLAEKYGVKKFIHASTGSVYGEPQVLPQTERHPLNPCSYYGVSKLAGERYVDMFPKEHNLDVTILRYFHVYGERQDDSDVGGVVSIFVNKILNGEPIQVFGTGEQTRTFTYVGDVIDANIAAMERTTASKNTTFNCSSGIATTLNQLISHIELLSSKKATVQYSGWQSGDVKEFYISNDLIQDLLRIEFTELKEGLKKVIDWYV